MARKTLHGENAQLKQEIKELKARVKELEYYKFQVDAFRHFLIRDRNECLLEKYPMKLIYEEEDAWVYEIPDQVYDKNQAETDGLTKLGSIEIFDDPYIPAMITFNSEEDI